MFTARGLAKVAIVINDTHLDCVESLTNEWGVRVPITGSLGRWFRVSKYCPPKADLEQYIAFLDEVVHSFWTWTRMRSPLYDTAGFSSAYFLITLYVEDEGGIVTFAKHDLFCLNAPLSVYMFESSRVVGDIDVNATGVSISMFVYVDSLEYVWV